MVKNTKANEEPTTYAEIGIYLHKEGNGKVSVKTYTSVNKALQVDASEEALQIGKVRVEMRVTEDKNVDGNKVYEKTIDTVQVTDPKQTASNSTNTATETPEHKWDDTPSLGNDFKTWCKNTYDQLENRVTKHDNWLIALGVGVGVALVGVIGLVIALY